MGFYGNITNTSNTTFQFDKIYPNRLTMDANTNNDGIFVGRYVLIEYQEDAAYPIIYIHNNKFYSSPNHEETTRIKFIEDKTAENKDGFYKDEIAQTIIDDKLVFYICTDGIDGYANFSPVEVSNRSDYVANFNIDEARYGVEKGFKGYDSTVWTKVSETNKEGKLITKYVNIADLNSVVPTFDIAADAPSMKPITPHFDTDNTNVYYRLHTQPQWGFRVAQANGKTTLSDVTTEWKTADYIPETDSKIIKYGTGVENGVTRWSNQAAEIDAAIYYNAGGFKKQLIGTDERGETINKHSKITQDIINIMPTGKSGNEYETHDGTKSKAVQEDIQELTIQLPSIGNMVSDVWDIVHGPNRDNYRGDGQNASLQGKLDSFDAFYDNQIPVKRTNNGKIVGSRINGAANYDNNATWTSETKPKEVLYDDSNPNFNRDDAWIKTEVFTADLKDGDKNTINDQSGNSGISIHHTFHATANSTSSVDKNIDNGNIKTDAAYKLDKIQSKNLSNIDGKKDFIELYTPYVDAKGHVVGKNIETVTLPYGYKTITTQGLAPLDNKDRENVKDLYTEIINQEDGNNTSSTNAIQSKSVADNTQDTIAIEPYNKWIQTKLSDDKLVIAHEIHAINTEKSSTDLNDLKDNEIQNKINIPDWDYDEAGHIKKKGEHTYTLPFGYKYIEVANDGNGEIAAPASTSGIQEADSTQDTLKLITSNKWILLDGSAENTVQFGHLLKTVPTTSSDQSLSNEISETITFEVYNDSFDEAGHHNGRDTKTLTMPFGYGKIKGDDNTSTAATATYDELNVISGDNWIKTKATEDTITITHTGPVTTDAKNESNKTPNFGDTFIIEDWVFDNKGHKANLSTHTVKIPRGSLNDLTATSSSVLTGISMVPETGVITQTHNDVGKLALIGYTTSNDRTDIGSGDTINSAFAKLQNQISYEESRINTILNGTDDLTETLDTFIELQTYVKNHGKEAADMATAINNEIIRAENAETTLTNNLNTEISRATNAENTNANLINQEILRAIEEEGKLNTRIDNLVGNTTVSTQIDNKINTFNSTLGSAAYTESDMYALAGSYDNRVLQSVYDAKIKELEATIVALTARIEALEPELETPVEGE